VREKKKKKKLKESLHHARIIAAFVYIQYGKGHIKREESQERDLRCCRVL
jgi:hypothetical protein